MNNYEDLDNLHLDLAGHDWWYQYSDDHSVWTRGQKAREEIGRRADRLGKAGSMLWEEWTQYVRASGNRPVMPSDRSRADPLLKQWRTQAEDAD